MKKIISILIVVVMVFTMMAGCGKKETEGQITEVEIILPVSTGTRAVVEGEAVITTQVYLLARAYFEKLETYDMDSFDAQEYSELLAKAVEAFRIAEAFNDSFEKHASILAQMEEKGLAEQEKSSYKQLSMSAGDTYSSPFVTVAYAAEEKSAAVKYAEDLTKTFDDAKNGQKLKAVAEKYGTDVKKAKAMLEQAQAILEGAAYEDQAAFENKCYEVAMDTKAVCSTATFVLSCAVTGGATAGGASLAGVVEAGGVVFNGVSAIIDVGTAWTIHSSDGDGNEYTAAWDKTAEMVAPVAAAFSIGGGIQNYIDFKNPAKAAKKIDNAAQAFLTGVGTVRDYIQDGTVLGVSSNIIDGYRQVFARSADANTEAAKEVLLQTGVSEEALTSKDGKTASDQAQESTGDEYIEAMGDLVNPSDPLDVEAILEVVDTTFKTYAAEEGAEAFISETKQTVVEENSDGEQISDEAVSNTEDQFADTGDTSELEDETEVQSANIGGAPAIQDVAGTYRFEGEGNPWTLTFEVVDDTHLRSIDVEDSEAVAVGQYDANTGVFSYSEGDDSFSASARATFTDTGNGIKAVMVLTLSSGGESMQATGTAMKE